MKKVEPQVITGWSTGPNYTAGETPWYRKGGCVKMKKLKMKKGGSKKGFQNGPTGFGY